MMNRIILLLILWLSAWHGRAEESSLPTPLASPSRPTSDSTLNSELTGHYSAISNDENMNNVLDPDAAFIFSTTLESPSLLVAHWDIAEGYYLYRDKFKFSLKQGGILGEPQLPVGKIKEDIKYGRLEVYEHQVSIKLPLQETQELASLTLETSYQGCADGRFCYPPLAKTSLIKLPKSAASASIPSAQVAHQESSPNPNEGSQVPLSNENKTDKQPEPLNVLSQLKAALGLGEDSNHFLKAEEAFVLSVESPDPKRLILRWQIAAGYYLYKDKLKVTLASSGKLGTPQFPTGTLRTDRWFGEVFIYRQPKLEIVIPLEVTDSKTIALKVEYQGCALAGFCYPPIEKEVTVPVGQSQVQSEEDRLANLLAHSNIFYVIVIFFGLGLLLSLTPCIYPMIPILSSLIVGQGWGVTTSKAFFMSLVYVLAMSVTYAVVGALTGLLGENLQTVFQTPWILVSFALVFVALSLSMFGLYELQLPVAIQTKLSLLSNRQQGGNLIGVTIMGILSALIVGPCVAAPLAGALIYIGQTGDALLGGLALFALGVGMGMPLIVIGTSAGHLLPKKGEWMEATKAVFGVLLLATAIWMVARILPAQVTMLLWASLLIVSAVYMGALDNLNVGVSGWRKLWKGVGLILLIYGVLLMIGAARGNFNLFQPLQTLGVSSGEVANVTPTLPFKPIKGLSELEREIAAASAQHKPVMLDFYADWCISCKEMEQFTLTEAQVQKLLSNFVLLRTDVTANDDQDKALYKQFGIYGPPAILFFSTTGQEQRAYRVIGFMPAAQFRTHLEKVLP
jgi:thiol:disulfide interchange protein DsbD